MSQAVALPVMSGHHFERAIGRYDSGRDGPCVIVCGGLHGNEPAGAYAAQRVIEELGRTKPPLRGELIAVAGNVAALALNQRYQVVDLNRCWLQETVDRVRGQDPSIDTAEEAEQRALLAVIDEAAARRGALVVLDLHTTSADGPPFTLMSDTLRNRRVAFHMPGPKVLGLEESVDGTLLEYLTQAGHTAVVIESGQHADPGSIDRHEAIIWLGLVAAGSLEADEVPRYSEMHARLHSVAAALPRVVELRYRHEIGPDDGFVMEPGHRGFDRVEAGQVVATDRNGPVKITEDGRLLMPLYQSQGDDGYFLVRRVHPFWLALSAGVRRLRLHVVLPLLPGVRRHPSVDDGLRVDPRIARWFTVEILHLFGFRRRRPDGELLVFTRRRDD